MEEGRPTEPEQSSDEIARKLLRAAQAAAASGDHYGAYSNAFDALECDPLMPEANRMVGDYLVRNHWGDLEALLEAAGYFKAAGDFGRAVSAIKRVSRVSPASHDASCLLGRAYFEWRRFDEAIQAYERAVELDPDCLAAIVGLGYSLLRAGRLVESEAVFCRVMASAGDASGRGFVLDAARGAAQVCGEMGRWTEAVSLLEQLLARHEDDGPTWNALGMACFELGDIKRATECHKKAINLTPKDGDAWFYLGVSLAGSGAHLQAIAAFDKAIHFEPHHFEALYQRGLSFEKSGHAAKARQDLERAQDLRPDDEFVRCALARLPAS